MYCCMFLFMYLMRLDAVNFNHLLHVCICYCASVCVCRTAFYGVASIYVLSCAASGVIKNE